MWLEHGPRLWSSKQNENIIKLRVKFNITGKLKKKFLLKVEVRSYNNPAEWEVDTQTSQQGQSTKAMAGRRPYSQSRQLWNSPPFKRWDSKCWEMSIHVSQKGLAESPLLLFVLRSWESCGPTKVWHDETVSHAWSPSNITQRRQGFYWKSHSDVSLHDLFHRYHKCVLTHVQFECPCCISCQYCIFACFYVWFIASHSLDKSSNLFCFCFLIFLKK